ncbi:MAG: HAMP domain-containing histidine kinase [Acidithiobacillus sp.]|nr:HAMP domain-containing histidine kinase [Acidithiobacillus sp.]
MAIFGLPAGDEKRRRIPFAPFRTIGFLLVQFVVLVMLLLGVLLVHTNQDLARLKSYTAEVIRIARLAQQSSDRWQEQGPAAAMALLQQQLTSFPRQLPPGEMENDQLQKLRALTKDPNPANLPKAFRALSDWNLDVHLRGRDLVLAAGHDARYTLIGSVIALAAFMVFIVVTLVFFRTRILRPLRRLQEAMYSLETGGFRRVSEERADPGISPLLAYYNQLVGRLEELERQRRRYLQDLQQEVHEAASTLMAQQAAMTRSERMAAVGEAAAAFAHELRNPLAGLQVGCANMRREITDPELNARLGLMEEELRRVSRLLDQQLRGARQSQEKGQWVEPAEIIENLLTLIRYQLPPEITLRLQLGTGTGRCLLPVDQFRQALMNLVLNARQALADGPGEIAVELEREEDTLRLRITDTGPGFPEQLLRDGIRPFASGREHGTGLGLAMVRRFLRSQGGEVRLRNRSEGGAEVLLLLPCPQSTLANQQENLHSPGRQALPGTTQNEDAKSNG